MPPDPASFRRILVVTKFRYLGDSIVATPFLRRLAELAPDAEVTLLTGGPVGTLLQGCPWVSQVWPWAGGGGQFLVRSMALAAQVRRGTFDAAFLLNRSLHSAAVVAGAGVPVRVGFNTEHRGILLTARVSYGRERPEIECYLDLLRALGWPVAYALPELWVTPDEILRARELLPGAGRPLVLLQPGSKDPYRKQWAPERFAAVADGVRTRHPSASLALVGVADERNACVEVASRSGAPIANLVGRTGLREVLGLLAAADLLVANDSALVHAAVAVGTRTVSVQGPQTAAKWGYGPPHRVVAAPAWSGARGREGNRRALDAVPAGAVIEAANAALEELL